MAMALTLARFRGGVLTVAAAGMPPILVFRAKTRQVEEVVVEGVPLGSMTHFEYVEKRIDLESEDTVLLMTDGFPELANGQGEPMGYAAVQQHFAGSAGKPPQDLIADLAAAADRWSGGSSPSDDVTFVVLRVRA